MVAAQGTFSLLTMKDWLTCKRTSPTEMHNYDLVVRLLCSIVLTEHYIFELVLFYLQWTTFHIFCFCRIHCVGNYTFFLDPKKYRKSDSVMYWKLTNRRPVTVFSSSFGKNWKATFKMRGTMHIVNQYIVFPKAIFSYNVLCLPLFQLFTVTCQSGLPVDLQWKPGIDLSKGCVCPSLYGFL